MSATLLAACVQRCADATPPDEEPKKNLILMQMSTVFQELDRAIVDYLPLTDLAFVALRISRGFSAVARERIAILWPQLSPLLAEPFYLTRRDLLLTTELRLPRKHISDLDCSTLAAAAARGALAQCRYLYFNSNDIGDAGVTALASACASGTLSQCKAVDLSDNRIGDAGITALARAIKPVSEGGNGALPQCRSLQLRDNKIGDAGITALAQATKPVSEGGSGALPQCTVIDLRFNQIGDAGITALAQAIKPVSEGGSGALTSLLELVMDDNPPPNRRGFEFHLRVLNRRGYLNSPVDHPALKAACQKRGTDLS